jgi:hypothetical protein
MRMEGPKSNIATDDRPRRDQSSESRILRVLGCLEEIVSEPSIGY